MSTRSKGLVMRDRNNEDNGVGHPVYSNHWHRTESFQRSASMVRIEKGLLPDFISLFWETK